MATGFHINRKETEDGPRFAWFLNIGGPEDAVAMSYADAESEAEVVAAIHRLQGTDIAALPIIGTGS